MLSKRTEEQTARVYREREENEGDAEVPSYFLTARPSCSLALATFLAEVAMKHLQCGGQNNAPPRMCMS